MNILVLVKQTFDTEEKIVIQNGQVSEENVEFILNPYDEYAVEEAVKIKEESGAEVTVLTVGPTRSESVLRTALAMGADKGIIVELEEAADEYTIAKIIKVAIQGQEYDLILGGNMAVDSGAGQVAVRVAEELGIPQVSTITKNAALEAASANVRVNSIHPAPVNTRMMRSVEAGLMPGAAEAAKEAITKEIPIGRYGEPIDIAKLVLFLASDDSSFITGGQYRVDGGFGAK